MLNEAILDEAARPPMLNEAIQDEAARLPMLDEAIQDEAARHKKLNGAKLANHKKFPEEFQYGMIRFAKSSNQCTVWKVSRKPTFTFVAFIVEYIVLNTFCCTDSLTPHYFQRSK